VRQPREGCTAQTWTVAWWLRYWLSTRTRIRPTTLRSYTEHVERHLIPHLGRVRLGELTGRDVTAMVTGLAASRNRYGRPLSPATLHRIRATLRAALNAAIREGLIAENPARHIELPTPRRPQAQVWTDRRVQAWRERGERSAVAVWTAGQLAAFLDFVAGDWLYAMWWLIALRGLRRGEAAGLRWVDVPLDQQTITIEQQRIAFGRTVTVGPPKTAASRRTIALDRATVRILREHLRRQQAERAAAADWQHSGYVFTTPDGAPLHPDHLTRRFRHLVRRSGLPPVRLHDLRHGAASLSAGVDIKVVQETLGHSSSAITRDTYTSVLSEVARAAAEATARMIPRASQGTASQAGSTGVPTVFPRADQEPPSGSSGSKKRQVRGRGAPGDRTQNPRIKSPLLCQLS